MYLLCCPGWRTGQQEGQDRGGEEGGGKAGHHPALPHSSPLRLSSQCLPSRPLTRTDHAVMTLTLTHSQDQVTQAHNKYVFFVIRQGSGPGTPVALIFDPITN